MTTANKGWAWWLCYSTLNYEKMRALLPAEGVFIHGGRSACLMRWSVWGTRVLEILKSMAAILRPGSLKVITIPKKGLGSSTKTRSLKNNKISKKQESKKKRDLPEGPGSLRKIGIYQKDLDLPKESESPKRPESPKITRVSQNQQVGESYENISYHWEGFRRELLCLCDITYEIL